MFIKSLLTTTVKKRLAIFPSPAGLPGDGKIAKKFYSVYNQYAKNVSSFKREFGWVVKGQATRNEPTPRTLAVL